MSETFTALCGLLLLIALFPTIEPQLWRILRTVKRRRWLRRAF
jgi:uncharacterized protein YjeT (DUF2065 family)